MAPESALTDLRLRAAAARTPPEASRIRDLLARFELERNLLVAWAQEKGLALPADDYLDRVEATHGEHHVFYDTAKERYFKITHGAEHNTPGFALTVTAEFHIGKKTQRYIGMPKLREATPFEYLARLRLFNLTFQDDVQVEGVITEPGKVAIVISQQPIEGDAATEPQVAEFMRSLGFTFVTGVYAGRRKSASYFRTSDSVAVFDTHGENFFISGSRIVPIDGLIVVAEDDLIRYLTMTPDERQAELGQ